MELQDSLVLKVNLECQVWMVHLESLDLKEIQDSQEYLDNQDKMDTQEQRAMQEFQDLQDHQESESRVILVQLVHQASLEQMVYQEHQDLKEILDFLESLACQGKKEILDSLALQG